MVDTAMVVLTVEGTRKEAMAGWEKWMPRAQVVELMVREAKAELQ